MFNSTVLLLVLCNINVIVKVGMYSEISISFKILTLYNISELTNIVRLPTA